jgi:hypothetical protein
MYFIVFFKVKKINPRLTKTRYREYARMLQWDELIISPINNLHEVTLAEVLTVVTQSHSHRGHST